MDNPRAEKVAVVDEVRQHFDESDGALLTEYRGLNVAAIAELRRALREAGGEYKVYKNTLVRLAFDDLDAELEALLVGPTAIAFVTQGADGAPGDAAAVAKVLKDFAKTNEALVVKGGLLGGKVLSAADTQALADLPSKEVLLAQFAGVLQAPLTKFAQLLNAVPAKFAYGVQALIDQGGAPGAPVASEAPAESEAAAETEAAAEPETPAETEAAAEPAADAPAETDPTTESDNQES